MPVAFAVDFDDSGNPTVPDGTPYNNTWKQAMATAINVMSLDRIFITAVSPTIWAASQNNFAMGNTCLATISASTPVNLTGMVPVVANQILVLVNVGSFTITILHDNASSTATNRFFMTGGVNISMPSNAVRGFVYVGQLSRWRPWPDG